MPGDQRCHPYRPEDDPKADGDGVAPPELHCRVQAQVLLVPAPCAFKTMPPAASGEHPGGIVVGGADTKVTAAASHVLCALRPASGPCGHLSLKPVSAPVGCLQSMWSGTFVSGLGHGEEVVFLKESECARCMAWTLF